MRLSELIDEDVFVQDEKIGEIKDAYVDAQSWKITHLEIQLTKEAANEILGAITQTKNTLAISALEKGDACCTEKGLEIKVSKAQLNIYLRPPK
jgi:hypothetical protein